MKNYTKRQKILFGILLLVLFFGSAGGTYAFFQATVSGNEDAKDITATTGTLSLTYQEGATASFREAFPGQTIRKTFSVYNSGTLVSYYGVVWGTLVNDIINNELTMNMSVTTSMGDVTSEVFSNRYVPNTAGVSVEDVPIVSSIKIMPQETHTYTLDITFIETSTNQNYNQGALFDGTLSILETLKGYNINGTLVDSSNAPINAANVKIGSYEATTESDGTFLMELVETGSYNVVINDSDQNTLANGTVNIEASEISEFAIDNVTNTITTNAENRDLDITFNLGNTNNISSFEFTPTSEACFAFSNGTITDYYSNEGNLGSNPGCPKRLIIPSTIGGVPVTTIGSRAFYDKALTSIIIPDSVVSMSTETFNRNLTSDSLAFVCDRKDEDHNGIGEEDCSKIVSYAGSKKNNVTVPAVINGTQVIELGDSSFSETGLVSIHIPKSVTTIGDFTFEGNSLVTVEIPATVSSVGGGAYNNNSVTGDAAFVCAKKSVTVIDTKILTDCTEIVSYAGTGSSVTVPNQLNGTTVTKISDYAFNGTNLTSVTIPLDIVELGTNSFANNNLTNVTMLGKTSSAAFTTYDPQFGWNASNTCTPNNTSYDANGCITWVQ